MPVVVEVHGIDTKTNPRLVPSGSLLEAENLVQDRTGELRLRNGFIAFLKATIFGAITSMRTAFASADGNSVIGVFFDSHSLGYPDSLGFYSPTPSLWQSTDQAQNGGSIPSAVTAIIPVASESRVNSSSTFVQDLAGCDSCSAGGYELYVFKEQQFASSLFAPNVVFINSATREVLSLDPANFTSPGNAQSHATKCVATTFPTNQTNYFAAFYLDNSGTPAIRATIWSTNGGSYPGFNGNFAITAADLKAGSPRYDVMLRPGTNKVIVAYYANANVITLLEYDLSTQTTTIAATTFASIGSGCISWLENSTGDGNYYLGFSTAGSSLVSFRVFSSALASVSGPNQFTATSSEGATQIIGSATGSLNVEVAWCGARNTSTARWVSGVATVNDPVLPNYVIASRAFKRSDGFRFFIASFVSFGISVAQAHYIVYNLMSQVFSPNSLPKVHGQFLFGNGGLAPAVQSSLPSVWVDSSGNFACALTRQYSRQILNGAAQNGRGIVSARINFSIPISTTEVGMNRYVSGGVPGIITNGSVKHIQPLFSPDQSSGVTPVTGAGSLTLLATYNYVQVFKRVYENGQIVRSAPSVPATAVLTGTNNAVQIPVISTPPQNYLPSVDPPWLVEVYRAGPIASGATTYNKVFESSIYGTLTDNTSDTNAYLGETLYTTGNVLENFPPPSSNFICANADRIWVISSEDTTELWPSKTIKTGFGVAWHPLLKLKITGDASGGFTALASVDSRLIAFKDYAIYAITGDGPNDQGQGSFNAPQIITISNGTDNPAAVVIMRDGVMFQGSQGGIWLLDRGLSLTYVGAPVEKYTDAERIVGSSRVNDTTQIRFVMPSGRCLVWDYFQKQWTTFLLPVGGSSVITCFPTENGGWTYACADGTVYQENPGVFTDPGPLAIIPRVSFPHLALAGIGGYQRIYSVSIVFEVIGNCTISVDAEYDYSGAVTGSPKTQALVAGSGQVQVEYIPPATKGKTAAIRPVITSSHAAGSAAFRLTSITVWIGTKRGSPFTFNQRLT